MYKLTHPMLIVMLVASSALGAFLALQLAPQPVNAAANMSPSVRHTVLPVTCISVANFNNSFTKIADFGNFSVASPDATIEATFYGRVSADTLSSANGAIFELRIDDTPASLVWARANIRNGGYSTSFGVPVSMSGVFIGLPAGDHTVSIWVRAGGSGSGTGGRVDPGCWSSDHIVVREYAPFGTTFLPSIVR